MLVTASEWASRRVTALASPVLGATMMNNNTNVTIHNPICPELHLLLDIFNTPFPAVRRQKYGLSQRAPYTYDAALQCLRLSSLSLLYFPVCLLSSYRYTSSAGIKDL
jgi:hypothetical protein